MNRIQRGFILIWLLWMVTLVGQAQTNAPVITSFTTTATAVGRDALTNRTARIPVAWTTQNRPLGANLIFEQILPVGGAVNVELPRLINYVASEGTGIAAPILPPASASTGEAQTILLRVSLVSIITGTVYDFKMIELPIVAGTTGTSNTGTVPIINAFTVQYDAPIDPQTLSNGTARLAVRWSVRNRPITANLVFEQILADRRVVNVELPRPWAWVNSSDSGVVAPVPTGVVDGNVLLSLRLMDVLTGRTYDQKFVFVPVRSNTTLIPSIRRFSTDMQIVRLDDIQNGRALIPVTWSVVDRPQNSNLVFEQVLPDGTIRNAELPRSVPIVPSSGNGVVNAVEPVDSNALVYRLRIVDLATQATLASSQLIVTIEGTAPNTTEIEVTGDACFRAPFPASTGLQVGGQARVERFSNGAGIILYQERTLNNQVANVPSGATMTIASQPVCMRPDGATTYSRRLWQATYNGVTGWFQEYGGALDYGIIYFVRSADSASVPAPEIVAFSVTPNRVNSDTESVTIQWETRNTSRVYIATYGMDATAYWDALAPTGSMTISLANHDVTSNPITFELNASDAQMNTDSEQRQVEIASNVTINQFTVTPTSGQGNSTATFNWDIAGSFQSARIEWYPMSYRPSLMTIAEVQNNIGSYNFTLPPNQYGAFEIRLVVVDSAGVSQIRTTNLTITCAYTWGMGVQDSKCPSTPVQSIGGAYQTFERGTMIWTGTASPQIWLLLNDGTVRSQVDQWSGQTFTLETPPDGLLMPTRGFGYLWSTVPEVRQVLGWATQPEQSYQMNFQQTLSPARYEDVRWYFTAPDNRLIEVFSASATGTTWRYLN